MAGVSSDVNIILVAIGLVFVAILLWWLSRRAPGRSIAILVGGVLVVGIAIAALYQSKPEMLGGPNGTTADRAPAPRSTEDEARKRAEEAARRASEAEARLRELAEANKRRQREEEARRSIAKPPQPPPPPSTTTSRGAQPGAESQPSQPTATTAGTKEKWDVVPVFYGTDRVREQGPKRISYTAERGERLDIGRALVTVPKVHEVPNIERPWVYKVPFFNIEIYREKEDPSKHFTLRELKQLTEDEFISLVRTRLAASSVYKGHALLFVHGFNTTFDYAIYRAAQLSYDLKFDGGSFVYSWPSRGEVSATGYTWDATSSENAEDYLDKFLTLIAKKSGATSITVIAHSMGNKLLLPVLEKLKLRGDSDVKISQVILAAPDVDRDIFTKLAKKIQGISSGITLYAAANDRALDLSGQFWGGGPRAGDVPQGGPVVVPGIDTIDVTATSTDVFSLNHAGYAEKTELLGDIRALMLGGYRKPNLRIPKLQAVATPVGEYWKFP
ncbi:MAG: alpha/beta hydrolase [Hyphomicrobiaceae bacterium]